MSPGDAELPPLPKPPRPCLTQGLLSPHLTHTQQAALKYWAQWRPETETGPGKQGPPRLTDGSSREPEAGTTQAVGEPQVQRPWGQCQVCWGRCPRQAGAGSGEWGGDQWGLTTQWPRGQGEQRESLLLQSCLFSDPPPHLHHQEKAFLLKASSFEGHQVVTMANPSGSTGKNHQQ